MKPSKLTLLVLPALLCVGIAHGVLAQNAVTNSTPGTAAATNAPTPTNAPPVAVTPPDGPSGATNTPAGPDEVQLSFQGANVEMVVQWLAKVTGKTVVKHPRVQCQLTIVGSKNLSTRDAINVVYRALALEGFTTVESSKSILIVPEGQDVKMTPEVVDSAQTQIPEGRQRLVRVFSLNQVQAADMKEKLRGALSEKGTMEIVERSNQLMVTDLTDNLRLVSDLIKELDVPSSGDSVIRFYPLTNSEAEDTSNLLNLVLNPQPGGAKQGNRPPDGSMPGGPSPSGGSSSPPQVRVWADKTSNRLIASVPKTRLVEVQNLIDILDTDKPKDVTIRVITLKNVSAEDLVREIGPLYQKLGNRGSKESVEVTANGRSNSLIIFSNEANFKTIEKLVATLDTEDGQEKTMQTFPLKNAEAEDVAKQLQDLYKDQDSQSRSPFFFFRSSDAPKDTKKVNIVADRRRNSVIVQAPPAAMERLAKLVATLDEPLTDSNLTPRIYKLKYVNAADLEEVLNELFKKKKPQRSYFFDFYDSNDSDNDSGDNKGASKLYGKISITSEPYSNAIIITSNSSENLAAVEDVLKQLDAPSEAGESTFRVGLKFGKAIDIASSLNILFAKSGSPPLRTAPQNPQQPDGRQDQTQNLPSKNSFSLERETKEEGYFPWLGGQQDGGRGSDGRSSSRPVSDLVGKVRVVPDRRINSVMISCNIHFLPQVMKLIEDLDAPTAQVLIEAKIIEVSSDFRDKLGVRWSPDGSKSFDPSDLDNSLQLKSGTTYQQAFGGPAGAALAQSLRSGVLNTSVNLDFLVQFLRKNTDSKVLAEPQINIADNELGKLFVGAQVPLLTGTLNTSVGTRNDSYEYREIGIILEVTPHVNDSEEVGLRIRAESSSIRSGDTPPIGGYFLDTRNFRTDVMVKSGQTVVLGGIIQREDINIMRKTPILGSIPGLGWAFKKKDKSSREVELMVFLRPWVSRTPQESKAILDRTEKRTPLIHEWENQPKDDKGKARKEADKPEK